MKGLELGKLPPQAIELEEMVLGAALIESDGLRTMLSMIKTADVFYKPAHKVIYNAIIALNKQSKAVDVSTVFSQLNDMGALEESGGAMAIVGLTQRINSAMNLPTHAAILIEKFTLREIIKAGSVLIDKGYAGDDALQLLGTANQILNNLHTQLSIKRPNTVHELLAESFEKMRKALTKQGVTGVPSGLQSVDRLTGGWQPSDLIIMAARPGMGKTSMALGVARNAAIDFNAPVAFFSLEMSKTQLVNKLIATEVRKSTSTLTKGLLAGGLEELDALEKQARLTLETDHLIIDDTAAITISQLRAKASQLKADRGIRMLVIDYLQLMRGDDSKGSREQEIGSISRGLKLIAKELDIPVIALSQLSRAVEVRADKKPQLSDLRESGSIEQDADVVVFLYRAEYYKLTEDSAGNPTANVIEVDFAKHRNGALDTVILGCQIDKGHFYDLNYDSPPAFDNPNKLPESNFDKDTPF